MASLLARSLLTLGQAVVASVAFLGRKIPFIVNISLLLFPVGLILPS